MQWGQGDAGLPLGRREGTQKLWQGGVKRMPNTRTLTQQALFRLWRLTSREAEVLCWVAQGKRNAEIGHLLGVSPRTVQKHLEHIYGKLDVRTRTAAALRVLTKGLGSR